jgi:hypothetical protein
LQEYVRRAPPFHALPDNHHSSDDEEREVELLVQLESENFSDEMNYLLHKNMAGKHCPPKNALAPLLAFGQISKISCMA